MVNVFLQYMLYMLIFLRFPDGLAWQFNIPKKVLRKSPEFKKFHSFLVFETEVVRSSLVCPRWDFNTYLGKCVTTRGGEHATPTFP